MLLVWPSGPGTCGQVQYTKSSFRSFKSVSVVVRATHGRTALLKKTIGTMCLIETEHNDRWPYRWTLSSTPMPLTGTPVPIPVRAFPDPRPVDIIKQSHTANKHSQNRSAHSVRHLQPKVHCNAVTFIGNTQFKRCWMYFFFKAQVSSRPQASPLRPTRPKDHRVTSPLAFLGHYGHC